MQVLHDPALCKGLSIGGLRIALLWLKLKLGLFLTGYSVDDFVMSNKVQ